MPRPQELILRTVSFTISGHIATTLAPCPGRRAEVDKSEG